MINMLRALMEKVNKLQEKMENVSKVIEILRKNHNERVEIKNTVIKLCKCL